MPNFPLALQKLRRDTIQTFVYLEILVFDHAYQNFIVQRLHVALGQKSFGCCEDVIESLL